MSQLPHNKESTQPCCDVKPAPLVWTTPSHDSSGSMPLGNGDIGVNVWVEENGDLLFYLSKTDAWDENACLLKLGRVRLALDPNPFFAGQSFRQELNLAAGTITIHATHDAGDVSVRLWVDANRPVVRIEISGSQPATARAQVEIWRTAEREREIQESHCGAGLRTDQERERVYPDLLLPAGADSVRWCHRNLASCWAATLEHQDMAPWISAGHDPLVNRTFGAMLHCAGAVPDGNAALNTVVPRKHMVFSVHVLTARTATMDEWVQAVEKQAKRSDGPALEDAYAGHLAWWRQFWQRSWLHVSGTPEAEVVSRGYALQRFMNACAGRGAFPIKFNGSIFTVDAREKGEAFDADYRRWGGGYWFQNTRLIYWPMIMSGDFDLIEPWYRMYLDALPFAMARAKACFGMDQAAMFPETMTFWGAFLNSNYGYARGDLPPGITENVYIRRYWQGMIELIAVMLDVHAATGDPAFLREKLLKLAPPFLRFYREYYPRRDDDGRMLFKPGQSLETWHDAVNPLPDIAGLQWVLDRLLALPEGDILTALRTEWSEFRGMLPPLPRRTYFWENRKELIPALQYDDCRNSENPELYAVFPYRLFGVGKPELKTARNTWNARRIKDAGGWRQDAIQAALLGLTDEARAAVVKSLSTSHAGSRFPAFWGPNFDWVPDQDHGGVACLALQRMLMQCDDGRILLLPAWPKDWDVDFRLHAPQQTVVEGSVRGGELCDVKVTPQARQKDVTVVGQDPEITL